MSLLPDVMAKKIKLTSLIESCTPEKSSKKKVETKSFEKMYDETIEEFFSRVSRNIKESEVLSLSVKVKTNHESPSAADDTKSLGKSNVVPNFLPIEVEESDKTTAVSVEKGSVIGSNNNILKRSFNESVDKIGKVAAKQSTSLGAVKNLFPFLKRSIRTKEVFKVV